MEVVQPMRSVEKLESMETVLRKRSERNWFLLVMGIEVRRQDRKEEAFSDQCEAAAEGGLIEIGTHRLRNTFGYHFYNCYKDFVLLKDSVPSISRRYIAINEDILNEVVGGFNFSNI
ncbi:hypothetical protein [Paenibacillus sp. YIM B09110]|uniref:hypothetical protein n=1 Tax=Paenibacillus sp. YIM B09110 TaxID=3126102 RepID=UPI00301DF53D